MNKNKFGEIIFDENDFCDILYQKGNLPEQSMITNVQFDNTLLYEAIQTIKPTDESLTVEEFDCQNQTNWYMPDEYKKLDIASYVLDLCKTDEQLQRVGKELLLYQEKDLFDLLRYLKYLIDTMKQNGIIWGVGRGSSVASYVLYLLEVHRIDSMYYDLSPEEFLR